MTTTKKNSVSTKKVLSNRTIFNIDNNQKCF